MRPIDADALIERLKYSFHSNERVSIETVTGCFLDETGCSPTIDAEPVRHGHWKMRKSWTHMVCSACSFEVPYDIFNYCPNCGADMRGGDNT